MYLFSSLRGRCGSSSGVGWKKSSSLTCFPKGVVPPMGSRGCWEPQFSGRSLRRETPPKQGEMLGIKGLECQEQEGRARPTVPRDLLWFPACRLVYRNVV